MNVMHRIALLAFLGLAGCGILIGSSDDADAPSPAPITTGDDAGAIEAAAPIVDAGVAEDGPSDAGREAEADVWVSPDPQHYQVAVSTALFDATNGSQAKADMICLSEFRADFVAWLSDANGAYLPSRLPNNTSWWNNGVVIFANKGDLGSGPQNPLPGMGRVWTGTDASGYPAQTCNNWTNTGNRPIGTSGSLGATGSSWTNDLSSSVDCTTQLPVICFQTQP